MDVGIRFCFELHAGETKISCRERIKKKERKKESEKQKENQRRSSRGAHVLLSSGMSIRIPWKYECSHYVKRTGK